MKTSIKLIKLRNGKYLDAWSGSVILRDGSVWNIRQECTGELLFSAKTLKECKMYQKSENEIASWREEKSNNSIFQNLYPEYNNTNSYLK